MPKEISDKCKYVGATEMPPIEDGRASFAQRTRCRVCNGNKDSCEYYSKNNKTEEIFIPYESA